jgi:hypothetical protein
MADVQYKPGEADRWLPQYLAALRAHAENVAVYEAAAQRALAQRKEPS